MIHKKEKWRYLLTSICLFAVNGRTLADSLNEQRHRYQQIKYAWDNNQIDVVEYLMPTLKDYPLYPYLKYRQLSQYLDRGIIMTVSDFIKRYPNLPLVSTLVPRFINELARREDWRNLLMFSPQEPIPVDARCNWYYAKWITGQHQAAIDGANKIWLRGTTLPSSCDKLLKFWQISGKQTTSAILERICLAMAASNGSLVNLLAKQLPSNYQATAKAVVKLQNNPSTIKDFARRVKPTDFTRQATLLVFARHAREDAEDAMTLIPTLAHLQKMNKKETQRLREIVAWQLMRNDVSSSIARWRDSVVMNSSSISLIERRLRLALGNNDRYGLNTWIARLDPVTKEKDEWQYWQADLLLERGCKEKAENILRKLMQSRGFYPMVAAQRLGIKYTLRVDKAPLPDSSLDNIPEVARVRELMYWGMNNLACTEWSSLVSGKALAQKSMLARYALDHCWWDLSVQATIAGKLWNYLVERFPLAWQTQFIQYTYNKDISSSYAMAIARQESAWNPKARSPVGAAGLMQIMPTTANYTVKMYRIMGYDNSAQLLDPKMNIQIGTQYLEYIYQQFEQNRIFTAAAYNAGPGRVRAWQRESNKQLDAVAFIESIPFSETRGYVKNVLAYDAYYRYLLNQSSDVLSNDEWQCRY